MKAVISAHHENIIGRIFLAIQLIKAAGELLLTGETEIPCKRATMTPNEKS
jgi:hypothetical protein